MVLVVVPTVSATLFYTFIAAPRFVSESQIIVRSASTVRLSGLDMLFRTIGLSKAVDDAYVVRDYLLSRDVIRDLAAEGVSVRDILSRPAGDRLSRFPRLWREDSQESLYDFYRDRIDVTEDSAKGILTLRVIAFTPEDANRLAETMLRLAESMVNRMNARAQRDATESALEEVRLAQQEIAEAQAALTTFRNAEALLDPSKSSLSVIETIGQLSTDLAYAYAQLSELQKNSPGSPVLPSVRGRIAALEARIKAERGTAAGASDSLASKIAAYDQLNLRRDIAEKRLASAMTSLEAARQEARRQHIYIEQVVRPNLPDESTEPRRIRSILTVLVVGLVLFASFWIISVGVEEHGQ
ncbi:MAG: capsule biosynthesis protein [Beijerinckiaceae bacterium]